MDPSSQPPPGAVDVPAVRRAVVGIGLYAAAFGTTFGAVAAAAGLTVAQALLLSVVMFTGASQLALVGVLGAGGGAAAGIGAALLLGLRNAFYGVPVTEILRPAGLARLWTAHFVIDETTAMATAQPTRAGGRYAFWATGLVLFVAWGGGTLAGAAVGAALDTQRLGLDAAAPAIFLALLWPRLATGRRARAVALGGAAVALVLLPITPPGVPVIAAAAVAVLAGLRGPAVRTAAEEGA